MANQKRNDIFVFLETKLATNADLVGKIKVTREKEAYPGAIKDYGVRLFVPEENPYEVVKKKIGNILHEMYHTGLEFIFNRNLKSRELYSDAKGLSYWQYEINRLLLHQTNSGVFETSWWEYKSQEEKGDCIILKGIHHCEVRNIY